MNSALDICHCETQDFCFMAGGRENFSCSEWSGLSMWGLELLQLFCSHEGSQPKDEADTRRRAEVKEVQKNWAGALIKLSLKSVLLQNFFVTWTNTFILLSKPISIEFPISCTWIYPNWCNWIVYIFYDLGFSLIELEPLPIMNWME